MDSLVYVPVSLGKAKPRGSIHLTGHVSGNGGVVWCGVEGGGGGGGREVK